MGGLFAPPDEIYFYCVTLANCNTSIYYSLPLVVLLAVHKARHQLLSAAPWRLTPAASDGGFFRKGKVCKTYKVLY